MTYLTLDGRVLDLSGLSDEERRFFGECLERRRAGLAWSEFSLFAQGSRNPLVVRAGRVTPEVWAHPLFQAVRDLEDRLGIEQGFLRPGPDDDPSTDPLADEWVPSARAAEAKGVTLPGLHKAVKRGDLVGRVERGRLEVSRRSLERWTPDRVRQAARRRH